MVYRHRFDLLGEGMAVVSSWPNVDGRFNTWFIPTFSLTMAVPLSLGTAYGMEFNFAHLLLPVVAFWILSSLSDRLTLAFLTAGGCGVLSIAVAHYLSPGNLVGNLAELTIWTMMAPAFLFVGRALPIKPVVFWAAVFSAAFLIIITLPLILTGEPVRAMYLFDTPGRQPGTEFINVHLLGLPVFATYGVNSFTPLLCIQAALLCSGIATNTKWLRVLFAIGLACVVFLVLGSNSRAAQGTMILLAVASFAFCFRTRDAATAIFIIAAAAAAVTLTFARDLTPSTLTQKDAALPPMVDSRMIESVGNAMNIFDKQLGYDDAAASPIGETKVINEISTGRIDLWREVASEVGESPIVGNGFSGFGRFSPPDVETGGNTTAHNYYLNLLWKGGLLFFIPFAAFCLMALWRAWEEREQSPQYYFAATAVVLTAFLPSLTWDILIVPSAGALAWFLLGSLGSPSDA